MGGKYQTIVILNVERKKKIMKNMQNIIVRAYTEHMRRKLEENMMIKLRRFFYNNNVRIIFYFQ